MPNPKSDNQEQKKCNYYIEVVDLEIGDCKTFECHCRRHAGGEIVVYVIEGKSGVTSKEVRQVRI